MDIGKETEAYAAYLNAPRGHFDTDQQELLDQDTAKARAQMERAWLEAKPTTEGRGMKVYVAGPMTGIPQFNFPAFDVAVASLEARGYEVIPPADLRDPAVRAVAMHSATGDLNDLPRHMTWGEFLANDVRLIADGNLNGIVVLEGWQLSRGSRLETYVGRLCGLPVFEYGPSDPLRHVTRETLSVAFGGVA